MTSQNFEQHVNLIKFSDNLITIKPNKILTLKCKWGKEITVSYYQ